MTGSIGVDVAVVDTEVLRLRADLESVKEDLQRTRTELAAAQAEANRVSLALTSAKQDLEVEVKELRAQLRAAREAQPVREWQRKRRTPSNC